MANQAMICTDLLNGVRPVTWRTPAETGRHHTLRIAVWVMHAGGRLGDARLDAA